MGARKLTGAQLAEIDKRRTIVAANLLAGLSYRDIAALTNYSLGTVAADAKYLRKQWQKEALDDVEKMIAQECKRLDVLMNAIWQQAVGSRVPGQAVVTPNMDAIEACRRLIAERRALLGIVAPKSVDVTSGGDKVPIAIIKMDVNEL
jgi:hypothetical protein